MGELKISHMLENIDAIRSLRLSSLSLCLISSSSSLSLILASLSATRSSLSAARSSESLSMSRRSHHAFVSSLKKQHTNSIFFSIQ